MSRGELLYLLMCVGTFTLFAVVLAIQSWHQSKLGRDVIVSTTPDEAHLGHAAHA